MCRNRQSGFALVSGIFILVVLAVLGAFIVSVSTSQHAGEAIDIEGARAYQAARAGVEWGVYQVLQTADAATSTYRGACQAAGATYANPTSQNLTFAGDLAPFGVTVRCGSGGSAYTDGDTVWVYQIEATACSPAMAGACPNTTAGVVGSTYYVERRIRITVTN